MLDSRAARDGAAIRRRRMCLACGQRFTTYEEVVRDALRVVKRDGRREAFSRQKLTSGIMRACEKRPIGPARVVALVDAVVEEIEQQFDAEVPSGVIGEKVMRRLEQLVVVAYVRFGSVYRRFAAASQFINAVSEVERKG